MQSTYLQPWAQQGACVGHPNPQWWEAPEGNAQRITKAVRARHDLAKEVCGSCPVTEQCLAAADAYDVGTVRGGETITHDMVGAAPGRVLSWPKLPPQHGTPAALSAHAKAKEPFCPVCREADSRRTIMENGWLA